jgi:hypothetical protein
MLSQELERRSRIFNSLRFVDLLIELDRLVPVVTFVG